MYSTKSENSTDVITEYMKNTYVKGITDVITESYMNTYVKGPNLEKLKSSKAQKLKSSRPCVCEGGRKHICWDLLLRSPRYSAPFGRYRSGQFLTTCIAVRNMVRWVYQLVLLCSLYIYGTCLPYRSIKITTYV